MRRSRNFPRWQSTALLIAVLMLVSFGCKHPGAPPPPPPLASAATPPQPVLPAPVITLRADNATIQRGGSVTLTWDARNAATVDIQPEIGRVGLTGTRQMSPVSSLTYTATATGPGGSAADTLRITVNEPQPPEPIRNDGSTVAPPIPSLSAAQLFERNMQPVTFDYDKSNITPDQIGKLQTAVAYLNSNTNVRLTIEGHADERGSEEYNLALGDRRANAVKQYFIGQGIAENRLTSVSYGEERPACSMQTEACYAQNRRAAFASIP